MALTIYEVIKRPIISQKSYQLANKKQIAFQVDKNANAPLIKKAVEIIFNVKVKKVNTHIRKLKSKRVGRLIYDGPVRKYAYVTLSKGYEINFFEQQVAQQEEVNTTSEKAE